jgi:hypothetical protein
MYLPFFGKLKLVETSKGELLEIWNKVLNSNNIKINLNEKNPIICTDVICFFCNSCTGDTNNWYCN